MEGNSLLSRKNLYNILQKSITVGTLNGKELDDFKVYLSDILTHIWVAVAKNQFSDSSTWLLYSRIAVIGLQVLSYSDKDFCDTIHFLSALDRNTTEVYIKEVKLKALIDNSDTFKISVLYGALSLLNMRSDLCTDDFRFLYDHIIVQCQQQSRHNNLYFQMLSSYVARFSDHISKDDYTNIFDTIYYNLDKKDCCSILQHILNETDIMDVSNVLHSVLFSMSWKYKQKYILLNEILQKHNLIKDNVCHDECIKGLIYAQSITFLASAGAKLYNTIVRHLEDELWVEKYYPALEKIIIETGSPTLCHKNILKYYLNSDLSFPCCFLDLFEKILSLKNPPVYTILSLTIIGIKRKNFPQDYGFHEIISLGQNDKDDYIRAMTFSIICSTIDMDAEKNYHLVQNHIKLNINDAGPATRDSIKKSFTLFLTKLENKICQASKVDISDIPAMTHSSEFFDWLMPFLFDQFQTSSNYQRLTLSVSLLHITLISFAKLKQIINQKCERKYLAYISCLNIFYYMNSSLTEFIEMLKICQSEDTEKIIQILLSDFDSNKITGKTITYMEELGMKNICDSNIEIAEFGQKLILFIYHIKSDKKEERLDRLKELMQQQWEEIKNSETENVIVANPLYPAISLLASTISTSSSKEYDKIFAFINDVVTNLLNVFGIRAMLPYNHKYCSGIAKAFQNESSKYHSCIINCMWLVLKACCELCVQLVKIVKTCTVMRHTLDLLNAVVQKCYHKGALEEAGGALAHVIASATTQNYCIVTIEDFLNTLLNNISKATESNSTVRRAAEIRVVLNAIAVNDRRTTKPFFHTIMSCLVRILDSCLLEKNPEKDPVHALALHCLQPIIINNLVETHIVEYISTVAIISLSSFESKSWKVRNAALQTFGAVSNKLLGTTVCNNDDFVQHHATCMEEVFYKHPAIYQYILGRICEKIALPEKHCEVIIPVLSFINMSYARDDQLVDCTKKKMSELAERLLQYIDIAPNMDIFMLAAKAYSSMCYHREIVYDVQRLSDGILKNVDNNNYVSIIYTMKILTDKIIEDADMLPNFDKNIPIIFEKIGSALGKSSNRKSFHKIISGILFYRLGLQSVTIEQMEKDILYLCTNLELTARFPGIWECMENKVKLIIASEDITKIKDLIKFCLDKPTPLNIKVACIQIIKARVQNNEDVNKFCSEELINLFVEIILDEEYIWIKYLTDECVDLIIELDIVSVSNCLKDKILSSIDDIQNNLLPMNYMAVLCFVCVYREENRKIKDFLEWCTEQCIESLKDVEPDILILRSVQFIWWYGELNQMNDTKFQCLTVLYKMLQRDETEIQRECENIFITCLDMTPTFAFSNMLDFINRDLLVKLLGPVLAVKLLVHIYCDRDEKSYSTNVFNKKTTVAIDTDIVSMHIYDRTFEIFKTKTTTIQRKHLIKWYQDFKKINPNKRWIKYIGKVIERSEC